MTLPPLARSLAPLPEESLPGFLLRLAHRLGRSPGRIASLCGLAAYERRPPAYHLFGLPDDIAATFAAATRLSLTEVNDLTLRRYAATYPVLAKAQVDPKINMVAQREYWAFNASSRYCPECLSGDGSPVQSAYGGPWKLRWHLPVVFACPLHHRLLEVVCPKCGKVLGGATRNRGSLVRQPKSDGLHPLQCRNPMPEESSAGRSAAHREACRARLDTAPQTSGSHLSSEERARMIALQERLNRRLAPDPAEPAAGEGGDPFPDLILAAQLIKLSWPAGADLTPTHATAALIDAHAAPITAALDSPLATTRRHLPDLWPAPADPATCGALLLAADALLSDREPASLRERVQPLVQAAYERAPKRAYHMLRSAEVSAPLARALVRRRRIFHAGGSSRGPGHLRVPSRDCGFSPEEVPQLLPQAWFDDHLAHLIGHILQVNSWTVRHLRRAASLKLMEMTAGGTWDECAETLGMPRGSAAGTLDVLGGAMPSNLWEEFEAGVERIAAELDSHPSRVNYAQRRRGMATWRMPMTDWPELCHDIPKLGRLARQQPHLATVLVWAEVTQSEHLNCPLLATAALAGRDRKLLVDQVGQYLTPAHQKAGRLELRRRLDLYSARLAVQCDAEALGTFGRGTSTRPPCGCR
ncbi:TniQ family protein [Streptomyces sp. NPDC059650]|uniref:TniQ family protein n=1 Tax=Streptomyces sp. NPDC059650 TaxID=3346896 RepID=UPI003681A0DD